MGLRVGGFEACGFFQTSGFLGLELLKGLGFWV